MTVHRSATGPSTSAEDSTTYGYVVARAYAGHDGKSDAGTTSTYVRADVYEVARALAALTGERQPLVEA